jgi:hypothetical protein
MTEEQWLTSNDPVAMVEFVQNATTSVRTRWQGYKSGKRFTVSERKWRLLACAAVRRIAEMLPEAFRDRPLDLLERAAEGEPVEAELDEIRAGLTDFMHLQPLHSAGMMIASIALHYAIAPAPQHLPELFRMASLVRRVFRTAGLAPQLFSQVASPFDFAQMLGWLQDHLDEESPRQAELVRCILGNPFHPVTIDRAWLAANDDAASRIAQTIHDDCSFQQLPILADALEDAGCNDEGLLAHGRTPGLHARGCWVVDGVLGKE